MNDDAFPAQRVPEETARHARGTSGAKAGLRIVVASGLLLLAAAGATQGRTAALSQTQGDTFEFRSGLVVDAKRGVGYLMNAGAGIEALDFRSGRTLWKTSLAQKPLLLLGNTLVAQAESREAGNLLRIVLLDTQHGGARKAHADITLPTEVRAAIDDSPGSSFRVRALATSHGLTLAWSYSERTIRGAIDSLQAQPPERRLQGAAGMDPETGRIVGANDSPEPPPPPLPANLKQLANAGSLPGPLWRSSDVYAMAAKSRENGIERTVLKRWRANTGESLPDVALFSGRYTIRYPSADGRHLLVSRLEGASPEQGERYEWLIFSLATGERIAAPHLNLPGAWFFVLGALLVHEAPGEAQLVGGKWVAQPRQVKAVDLQTGADRWARPLRETEHPQLLPPMFPGPQDSMQPSQPPNAQSPEGRQTP